MMSEAVIEHIGLAIKHLKLVKSREVELLGYTFTNAYDFAIVALEEKIDRLNPQPLTLAELKTMEGQPVWIVGEWEDENESYGYNEWIGDTSLDKDYFYGFRFGCEVEDKFNLEDYGKTWVAYRYQPREEGE